MEGHLPGSTIKKFLITGVSGFVGNHFLDFLEASGIQSHVLGVDLTEPKSRRAFTHVTLTFKPLDLLREHDLESVLLEFRPDYVLHLASYSSVAFSWREPALSFQNNMNVFLNLVETIRRLKLTPRILSVGSSEVYGNANHLPLSEEAILDPVSPYAVARVSQEMLSRVYAEAYDMDLVITRSFNHLGPGQKDVFVVASFAKQIASIKKSGQRQGALSTGDLTIIRDFLDARDVVRAYYLLLTQGKKGRVYNVCSGQGRVLKDVVDALASMAGIVLTTETNPALVRPSDNRAIIGSNQRIYDDLGWRPSFSFQQSLEDLLNDWTSRV